MYVMPFSAHISISFLRIGRDASEIIVSPRQNFLKPPPVPEIPTVTFVPVFFWKSSATASVIGYTVEEPSIAMVLTSALTLYEKVKVEATSAAKPKLLILLDFIENSWICFKLVNLELVYGLIVTDL